MDDLAFYNISKEKNIIKILYFNKLMELNRKIKKSIKFLEKFSKQNKFDSKKEGNNHIHVYLLYTQLKYDINLGFKIEKDEKPTLYSCLKTLYSDLTKTEIQDILFGEEDEELLKIFFLTDVKKTKHILKLLISKFNSNEYVNINIEILDYLGNTSTDVSCINIAYGVLWLTEINPDLKIPKKFLKSLTSKLIEIANKNFENVRYTNTEALLILFMLKRILHFKDLDTWVEKFVKKQKTDGRWTNGYNSYFIDNIDFYDAYHTVLGLLVLFEYQTLQEYKNFKTPSPQELIEEDESDTESIVEEEVIYYKPFDYEQKNLIEDFSNLETTKKQLFEFEKIIPINQKYSIHYNIYNISFLIILIFLMYYASKLGRPLPVQ
jgi:hypothetical protein